MFKRGALLLGLWGAALVSPAGAATAREMPACATGRFVQRKTLADLDVTLTSTGTFRFEKERLFVWHTRKPVETVFAATPSNYTYTANGKARTQALSLDVSSLDKVFQIKEVAERIQSVQLAPETGFPDRVTVLFTNRDRLEIELKADGR